jgi:predicted ATPase/class 3 adenylate cyclase
MHCSNCGFANPEGIKFCGHCGAPLQKSCPACGFANPANFNFCGQCATPLTPHQSPITNSPSPAERRHLTVMFCDLVGSTPLSEQLDPEELRDLIQSYQQAAAEVIQRYDGAIAQYLGDGLLIYFGYPQAHEDDARRAILASLGIVAEIDQLNQRLRQRDPVRPAPQLWVRLGIHTGLVVVGEMGGGRRREQLALGETTNIAARLQSLAKPGTVVISAAVYRLVAGYFTCRPLGQHTLKGISRPLELYQVLRESRVHSRLEALLSNAGRLTPLVGREQELALLLARWEQARQGQGQVVLLGGEAGIGKSRLLQALKERVTGEPHLWLTCHGSPYYQNSPLYPVIDLLERLLRFKRRDTPAQKLGKLEAALRQYDLPLPDLLPLLTGLLVLPLPSAYPPLNLTPQRQRQKTLEALLAVLQRLTVVRPVIIVVEDLQWIDPSSLEMLDTLVNHAAGLPLLVLFTFRPEFSPPWPPRPNLAQLGLARLSHRQVEQLLKQLTGGKILPPELRRHILAKTDGVPIFVEELTKMILELDLLQEGAGRFQLIGPLPNLAIPATLHDSLMARLDRLGPAREVAQLGATLGREFNYPLLRLLSPLDEPALQENLAQLVKAELLHQRGQPPQAVYSFKHALIQETAYRSLLRRQRQQLHRQIAQLLTEQFPERQQTEPELLAYHYTAAGLPQPAIAFWQQAGQRAIETSANLEAIHHFNQALELLKSLPESPERIQQELQLQIALGAPLLMTKGYAAPEVEWLYDRARALCQQLEDPAQLASTLFGLWVFYLARTRLETALEMGRQLMALAEQRQDQALLLQAHQVQGINFFNLGQLELARTHLEQAIALYDPFKHGLELASASVGADRGVTCLAHLALTLWLLGYPDQALERSRAALALAESLSHPYSIVFARCWGAWLHQYRREAELTWQQTEAALAIAQERGFTLLEPLLTILQGWSLAARRQPETGLAQIQQGLNDYEATGAAVGQLHLLAMLAEVQGQLGQFEAGLATLAEAIRLVPDKGERFTEAELVRLKGELLRRQAATSGPTPEAESCFRQALHLAQARQSPALALRAALSLARYYGQTGRQPEARQLLAPIYHSFSQGFETTDLQEAKALLETINNE